MILDEYLNYLHEDDDEDEEMKTDEKEENEDEEEDREEEDQGDEDDEDDEEDVEEKLALIRKLGKYVSDPVKRKTLTRVLKKHKRKLIAGALPVVGSTGFYATKRADLKGQTL